MIAPRRSTAPIRRLAVPPSRPPAPQSAKAHSPDMKILFLGANPFDTTRLALDREIREITRRLRASPHAERFELVHEWALRVGDIQAALLRHRPQVVHFSGHGRAGVGHAGGPAGMTRELPATEPTTGNCSEILVENDAGAAVPIATSALAELFRIVGGVRCVVLNACHSAAQGEALRKQVDFVLGMGHAIQDEAAIAFAWAFYQGLGFGEPVDKAFELGKNQIHLAGSLDIDVPKLLVREGISPEHIRLPLLSAAERPPAAAASLDRPTSGARGEEPDVSKAKPLKRRSLLDRRLAAELIVSYPPQAGSRRVDARSQRSNLYALSLFENVLIENQFGSILAGLVSGDQLLEEAVLFVTGDAGDEPPELLKAIDEASRAWLSDPGFQLAASVYGRSKRSMSESLADAVAYLRRMLLLARRFDAAIVPHPDRWRLYEHWFESCIQRASGAEPTRTIIPLPEPAAAAAEAVSMERSAQIAQIDPGAPGAAPPVRLIRYGPMVYPFPAAYAKRLAPAAVTTYPAFTYEFCTAGRTEGPR
ncbi:CHAT domain-containing protein [Sorangium sp. So ce327]|uniref:CHAT domain-containing protein n=1 Tax=Sorangium sp. So ce327 TaxID=3133301 RepID=UPI003F5E12CA